MWSCFQANQTFQEFANVINLSRNFSQDYYFELYNYLNNSANIEFLRVSVLRFFTWYNKIKWYDIDSFAPVLCNIATAWLGNITSFFINMVTWC